MSNNPFRLIFIAWLFWIAFVIFGSWYPFRFRHANILEAFEIWWESTRAYKSKTDILVNLIVGIPTGFLTYSLISSCFQRLHPIASASTFLLVFWLFFCLFFSSFVELGQVFFSDRDPSFFDSVLQVLGSVIGLICLRTQLMPPIRNWNSCGFVLSRMDSIDRVTAVCAFIFVLCQIWPFIPSVSPSEIWDKLKLVNETSMPIKLLGDVIHMSLKLKVWMGLLFILAVHLGIFVSRIGYKYVGFSFWQRAIVLWLLIIGIECSKIAFQDRVPSLLSLLVCAIGGNLGLLFSTNRFARFEA